jgi:hypothetical protein
LFVFAASAVAVGAATKATDNRTAMRLLMGDFRVDTLQIASTPAAFNTKRSARSTFHPDLHLLIKVRGARWVSTFASFRISPVAPTMHTLESSKETSISAQ